MKFQEKVMRYISEAKRGQKAMAKSAGLSTGEAKKETHKLESNGTMAGIKKRAHSGKIKNPDAYIYGTERKILKQHAKKIGR